MENGFSYWEPMCDVIKITDGSEILWAIKPNVKFNGVEYLTSRYYTTRGQAFIVVGIIESLYKPGDTIDISKIEFLTKSMNRLISGKDWITG